MKFPVCNQCITKQKLCEKCNNAAITAEELEDYKKIQNALRGEKHLKDVEIKRVFSDEKVMVITCRKEDVPTLIGKNGIIAKKIEKKVKKAVRIASHEDEFENFTKDVLFPSNIIGINIVYDGEKEIYNVRLHEIERYLMKINPEFFKQIAEEIYKRQVNLYFE